MEKDSDMASLKMNWPIVRVAKQQHNRYDDGTHMDNNDNDDDNDTDNAEDRMDWYRLDDRVQMSLMMAAVDTGLRLFEHTVLWFLDSAVHLVHRKPFLHRWRTSHRTHLRLPATSLRAT